MTGGDKKSRTVSRAKVLCDPGVQRVISFCGDVGTGPTTPLNPFLPFTKREDSTRRPSLVRAVGFYETLEATRLTREGDKDGKA